jgi:hypothetical protein
VGLWFSILEFSTRLTDIERMKGLLALSFFIVASASSAGAEEVWRCPGNRYITSATQQDGCIAVEATESTGSKGRKLFAPKGGAFLDQPVQESSADTADDASSVLFTTHDSRPLQSSGKMEVAGDAHSPIEANQLRCLFASLVGDSRVLEACGGRPVVFEK